MFNVYIVHPELCAATLRTKHYWAYALTSACKFLDPKGTGWIPEDSLKDIQAYYGWSDSKLRRTLRDAVAMDWIHPANGRLYLAGPKRIAKSLNVSFIGKQCVAISADSLKSNNALKAAFLKAYLFDKRDHPMYQGFIRAKTGIPERTQRHYLNRAPDVFRVANYVDTGFREQDLQGVRDNGEPGAFYKDGRVLVQGPNTYLIQNGGQVSCHHTKSTRNANAHLRALNCRGTGQTLEPRLAKTWFDSDKAFYKSQKAISHGKLKRRSGYNILSQKISSSDGLCRIVLWDQYIDPLFLFA